MTGDAQAGQAGEKNIIDLSGALRETIGKKQMPKHLRAGIRALRAIIISVSLTVARQPRIFTEFPCVPNKHYMLGLLLRYAPYIDLFLKCLIQVNKCLAWKWSGSGVVVSGFGAL